MMLGFRPRVIYLHWVVSAAIITGLLLMAEYRQEWFADHPGTLLLAGLGTSAWGLRRARGDHFDDVVMAATIVVANTFVFALVVAAFMESDGPRTASYSDIIQSIVPGFGYLLIMYARDRRTQQQTTEKVQTTVG